MDVLYIQLRENCGAPAEILRRNSHTVHLVEPAGTEACLQAAKRHLDLQPVQLIIIAETLEHTKPAEDSWQTRNILRGLRQQGHGHPAFILTTLLAEASHQELYTIGVSNILPLRPLKAGATPRPQDPNLPYGIRGDFLLSVISSLKNTTNTAPIAVDAVTADLLDAERQRHTETSSKLAEARGFLVTLREDMVAAREKGAEDAARIAALEAANDALSQRLAAESQSNATLRADLAAEQAAHRQTAIQRAARIGTLNTENQSLLARSIDLGLDVSRLTTANAALTQRNTELAQSLEAAGRERDGLNHENSILKAECDRLGAEYDHLHLIGSQRDRVVEQLTAALANQKQPLSTTAITTIPGFHGLEQIAPGQFQLFGVDLKLAPRSKKLLAYLLDPAGEVKSLDDIRAHLYPAEENITDGTLRGAVFALNSQIKASLAISGTTFDLSIVEAVVNHGWRISSTNLRQLTKIMAPAAIPPEPVKPGSVISFNGTGFCRMVGLTGHWQMNRLWYKGQQLFVPPQQSLVIIKLMEAKGSVLSKEQLYEQCGWASTGNNRPTEVAPCVNRAKHTLISEITRLNFNVPEPPIKTHRHSGWAIDILALAAITPCQPQHPATACARLPRPALLDMAAGN